MTAIPHTNATGPGRTDAELALAAAAGDRRAFAGIYDRYADRLHDFCIGMLRDRDAAADCVQDTFCTAAVKLPSLREPDKLRPWLYSIARHEALSRLRDRRREQPSDELPDVMSHDAGPQTLAQRVQLADLIAQAAGGLSDRDRAVLELSYRHGMDGPELADALGVSHTNAGTMVHRVRDMVERSLGALLVSRRARSNPSRCPELAAILHGWDGQFTVLVRKRVSRHIETCSECDLERRRLVNPAALLGGAPVLIPAPHWLRDRTMRDVQLTSSATGMAATIATNAHNARHPLSTNTFDATAAPADDTDPGGADGSADTKRRFALLAALLIGIPLVVLGVVMAWLRSPNTPVSPIGETLPSATTTAAPTIPASAGPLPSGSIARPQPTGATGNAPGTITAVPAPTAARTTALPSSAAASSGPLPSTPLPTPPPYIPAQTPPPVGDMQAPPPQTTVAPATTYAPPPPDGDLLPPLKTYNPDLPYTEDPFVPPN